MTGVSDVFFFLGGGGLKFSTSGFFWVEDLTVCFLGLKNLHVSFWVRISARLIVLTQFKPKFPQDPKAGFE